MNNRYIVGFFLFLSIGAHASDTDTMTQIGENVVQIGDNLCALGQSAAGFVGNATLLGTKITAGITSIVARFPRLTLGVAAAGTLYVSWRTYHYYRIKQHLDNAKAFLYTGEPRAEIPTLPNNVLSLRTLNLEQTTRVQINNYLNRIVELKNNLRDYSLFADWQAAIGTDLNIANFQDVTVGLTQDQIGQVDQYIQSRVELLGSPQYYGLLESPFVWYNRLASPWREDSPITPSRSYASVIISPYQGEATKLTWELFKWEKILRDRLAAMPQV